MGFVIYFGGKKDGEIFLKNYIETGKYRSRVKGFYKELETMDNIDLNYNEFMGAAELKLAFINGIKI